MNSSKQLLKMIADEENRLGLMLSQNQDDVAKRKTPRHSNEAIEKQKQKIKMLRDRLQVISEMERKESERAESLSPPVTTASTPEMWNKMKSSGAMGPSISSNMDYDKMKQALRSQMIQELQMLSMGAGSIDPRSGYRTSKSSQAGTKRAMELSERLRNFDSWFDSMYQSEFGLPDFMSKIPEYPNVPSGAIPQSMPLRSPIKSMSV